MKLSMSMIQWYLKVYTQIAQIQNDTLSIRGLRFLSGNMQKPQPDFMYLGKATDYFSDKQYEQAHMERHCHSGGCQPDCWLRDRNCNIC